MNDNPVAGGMDVVPTLEERTDWRLGLALHAKEGRTGGIYAFVDRLLDALVLVEAERDAARAQLQRLNQPSSPGTV